MVDETRRKILKTGAAAGAMAAVPPASAARWSGTSSKRAPNRIVAAVLANSIHGTSRATRVARDRPRPCRRPRWPRGSRVPYLSPPRSSRPRRSRLQRGNHSTPGTDRAHANGMKARLWLFGPWSSGRN